MKNNEDLQKQVQDAIKWEPMLHAAEIGVIVKDGVVTLTGTVDSYLKKSEAETAAKNVSGVKAVIEKIEVHFDNKYNHDDEEVAKNILSAFKWSWTVPNEKVKVGVDNGWVTLEGQVQWNYQKEAAKDAIKNLMGVKGVTNSITIKSHATSDIRKEDIADAIDRNWSIDDQNIRVEVAGNKVTLSGSVDSVYQKEEAARIAWNAPGVWLVDNELVVEYED